MKVRVPLDIRRDLGWLLASFLHLQPVHMPQHEHAARQVGHALEPGADQLRGQLDGLLAFIN